MPPTVICTKPLDKDEVADFSFAIARQYWFELFLDDLPMWGYVGEPRRGQDGEAEAMLLYPHWLLEISYNADRVRRPGGGGGGGGGL